MLKVKIPYQKNKAAIEYALHIFLSDFLGFEFEVKTYEGHSIEITNPTSFDNLSKLTLDASFFYKTQQDFLKRQSMPVLPLANWTPEDDGLKANLILPNVPVLYGSPGIVNNDNHIHLNLDIFEVNHMNCHNHVDYMRLLLEQINCF